MHPRRVECGARRGQARKEAAEGHGCLGFRVFKVTGDKGLCAWVRHKDSAIDKSWRFEGIEGMAPQESQLIISLPSPTPRATHRAFDLCVASGLVPGTLPSKNPQVFG